MNRKLTAILIGIAFLCAFALVQPRTFAASQDAETFQNEIINPVMEVTADYYDPLVKASFVKTFRITFPPMVYKAEPTHDPAHHVDEYIMKSPASQIEEYETNSFVQKYHWYDGSVTEKAVNKEHLKTIKNGAYYEGWFPSPNQIADYIAYSQGWVFNYVIEANRRYETESGNLPPDIITETEYKNFPVVSDYDSGEPLIIEQNLAKDPLKSAFPEIAPKTDIEPKSFGLHIEDCEPNKAIGIDDVITVLIILLVAWLAWEITDLIIQLDTTKYSADDMADAYEDGFMKGANETAEAYEQRLADHLVSGDISNETYVMLRDDAGEAYNDVVTNFENPWDDVQSEGGLSWFRTGIFSFRNLIIIAIAIVIILITLYVLRRIGIFGGKKGSSSSSTTVVVPTLKTAQSAIDEIVFANFFM